MVAFFIFSCILNVLTHLKRYHLYISMYYKKVGIVQTELPVASTEPLDIYIVLDRNISMIYFLRKIWLKCIRLSGKKHWGFCAPRSPWDCIFLDTSQMLFLKCAGAAHPFRSSYIHYFLMFSCSLFLLFPILVLVEIAMSITTTTYCCLPTTKMPSF